MRKIKSYDCALENSGSISNLYVECVFLFLKYSLIKLREKNTAEKEYEGTVMGLHM